MYPRVCAHTHLHFTWVLEIKINVQQTLYLLNHLPGLIFDFFEEGNPGKAEGSQRSL